MRSLRSRRVSVSCILAFSLLLSARILVLIIGWNQVVGMEETFSESQGKVEDLDSKYIENLWKSRRMPHSKMRAVSDLLEALGFLVLILPVLQVALVLSERGKRKLRLHLLMALVAILGFFMEALSNLFVIGAQISLDWIARDFNLTTWSDSDDGLGWKVIMIVDVVTRGMMKWTGAFEYAVLGSILLITVVSASSSPKTPFPHSWVSLTLLVGCMCYFDFVFSIFRLLEWDVTVSIPLFICKVGTQVLFPVWLLVLSFLLPDAVDTITMEDVNQVNADPNELI